MDNFEFKLRIATNREQSKRLLSLGLKPETADCHIEITPTGIDNIHITQCYHYLMKNTVPAWSLSRLLELLPVEVPDPKIGFGPHHPELIIHEKGYNISIRRYSADCLVGTYIEDNPIECCVSIIEWLIKKKSFNKEYLK